jgi:hypothetical protein
MKQNSKGNACAYAIKVDGVLRYIGKGTNGGRRVREHIWIVAQVLRGQWLYELANAKSYRWYFLTSL